MNFWELPPEELAFEILAGAIPRRYHYLITRELLREADEFMGSGRHFDVRINEELIGPGWVAESGEPIGDLPGVTADGFSAKGLITLVPRSR